MHRFIVRCAGTANDAPVVEPIKNDSRENHVPCANTVQTPASDDKVSLQHRWSECMSVSRSR